LAAPPLPPALERDVPLLDRAALLRLRVLAADLGRVAFAPVDFARVDFALVDFEAGDFAFVVFDPDPSAEVLLRCPLRALDLLLAIPDPSLTPGRFLFSYFVAQQYGAITQCAGLCKSMC
jgi:hypothetical protein